MDAAGPRLHLDTVPRFDDTTEKTKQTQIKAPQQAPPPTAKQPGRLGSGF